jgi:hypothetical protein
MLGRQKAPATGRSGRNTSAPYDRFSVPYEELKLPPLADGTVLPPATRFWDYCQDPTWVPRASNITTVEGCKCLEVYQVGFFGAPQPARKQTTHDRAPCCCRKTQKNHSRPPPTPPPPNNQKTNKQSAFGVLSNVSCLGTETDRPFCYIKKNSCPPGATPMTSDFYRKGNSAYSQYDFCQPYTQAVKSPPALRTRNGCLCLEQYRWYDKVINGGTCVTGERQFAGRLRCPVDPKTCDPELMRENGGPYPSVLYRDMWIDLCD